MKVPVIDSNQVPLMPTTKHRAMRLVERGDATPFWKRGIWCIRLDREPSARNMQPIAAGVDPGSKREAIVLKSEASTIINVQMDAITHVSDRMSIRRNMRRNRRSRKTPRRACRPNRARSKSFIPPSTRARWQWKLRVLHFLRKLYPITDVVVENIKAKTKKGARRWNSNFSPLEVGKNYFYDEIRKFATLWTREGWETAETRKSLGLKKNHNKMALAWDAHCVDAWCLAYDIIGGDGAPDDKQMVHLTAIPFRRRQLHMLQPAKGGKRREHGGTRSHGFKRGSLMRHPTYEVTYIGGAKDDFVSLHTIDTGKRLTQKAKPKDLKFLTYNDWRVRLLPDLKSRISAAQV